MKKCVHCKEPNSEGWFYCRSCGNKASEPMYTTQVVIRDSGWATAIRKDLVDFSTITMEDSIKSVQNNIMKENSKKWNARAKKAWRQGD
jgi:hypothetical protein|tara:strand:+ start:194 stop:460 length:267 start_codon:yes stop_codon:yes gene_type:complete